MAPNLSKQRVIAKTNFIFGNETNFKNIRIKGRDVVKRLLDFVYTKFGKCVMHKTVYIYLYVDKDGAISDVLKVDEGEVVNLKDCQDIILNVAYIGHGLLKIRFEQHLGAMRTYYRSGEIGYLLFLFFCLINLYWKCIFLLLILFL